MLTQARLKELLHYDPETGQFTWLVDAGRAKADEQAGYLNPRGYRIIMIGGRNYRAARLAWLYVNGRFPAHLVDHRDRVRSNDRIANLREATHKQNLENATRHRDASPGTVGVYWNALRKRWQAKIGHQHKQKHLGWFASEAEAINVRLQAERAMFTHSPACGVSQ